MRDLNPCLVYPFICFYMFVLFFYFCLSTCFVIVLKKQNTLEIKNFKSIAELRMECKNLNILIGTNSSGKSTIQQALLLAGQNMADEEGLNGSLIQLGSFEENRCRYSSRKEIS